MGVFTNDHPFPNVSGPPDRQQLDKSTQESPYAQVHLRFISAILRVLDIKISFIGPTRGLM